MALLKGRFIDPSEAIKLSSDPTSGEDVARKTYVDTKSSADASAAETAAKAYADQKIADLVNGAPAMLDTLKELADALEEGDGVAETLAAQVGEIDSKLDQEIADRLSAVLNEQTARVAADSAEASARQTADELEETARQAADSVLDGKITTEKNRAEGEEARIEGKVDQEILDRQEAEEALDARLDVLEADPTTKAYVDGQVSSEATRAQGEESRIEGKVDAEELRAEGEEARIEGRLDQEISARQTAVSAEQTARELADADLQSQIDDLDSGNAAGLSTEIAAREAGDANLQSQVNTEKGRIDAILLASDADKDSFAEIVQLINSVDTENDSAFASYVLSNNAALATEQSEREAADETLQSNIEAEQARAEGEEERIEGKVDSETSARQSAVQSLETSLEAEETRAEGEEARIEGKVDQEILNRQSANQSLQSNIEAEETRAEGEEARIEAKVDQEVLDRQSAVSGEQSRAQGEESRIEGKVDQEILDRQSAVSTEQSARQTADQGLQSQITQEVSDRQSAVSGEQSRAEGEESRIEGKVDQEISDRQAAVSSEQTAREAADSALDTRLDALEAAPQIQGQKVSFTLSAQDVTNGYVEMEHEPMSNTMMVVVSGMVHGEEEDYMLSTTSGVTRISFIGDLASNLQAGDKVKVQFLKHSSSEGEGGGGGGGGGSGGGQVGVGPLAVTNVLVESSPQDPGYAKITVSYTAPEGVTANWAIFGDIWNGTVRPEYTSVSVEMLSTGYEYFTRPSSSQSTTFTIKLQDSSGAYSPEFNFEVPRP
jgi:hypothetical protein